MSNEEQVALAETMKGDFGLPAALAALELPRSTWNYHQKHVKAYTEKYAHLRKPLEAIARKHPAYGYRRSTEELEEIRRHKTNHKVVQKLHQMRGSPLLRNIKPPKPSGIRQVITAAGDRINLVAKTEKDEIETIDVAYTDFTELTYADGHRKAHLLPIVDHTSKIVLGWAPRDRAVTDLGLKAGEYARETLAGHDVQLQDFILHHDQDPVFTGCRWKDQIRVFYALNGARDNPEMESFNSRFKTENRSPLLDAQTLDELQLVVRERMAYHIGVRRHSKLGYQAPLEYIATLWQWSQHHKSNALKVFKKWGAPHQL